MKVVRWGMVGCGSVTERKSAPAFSMAPGSKLVAVASRRASSAHAYASRHQIDLVFEDPEHLIRSPEVDAIYIATPPSSHLDLALMAAEAGKPCCVEKPMAMSHNQALQMTKAFEAAGQPLFVAYYRRSLPRFRQVKEWLENGAIGKVRHVHWELTRSPGAADLDGHGGWRTDTKEAPGGYFEDLACHGLDLFNFLLGPIVEANGLKRNQQQLYEVPDAVAAAWAHDAGITGSGFWNFGAFNKSDRVEIIGSFGCIRFSVFEEVPVVLENGFDTRTVDIANPDPIQLHHVENIILHLAGKRLHPSLGTSAAQTEWVADRILGRTDG